MCEAEKWSEADVLDIINNFGLVVISRQGYELDNIGDEFPYIKNDLDKIIFLNTTIENIISSSRIRHLLSNGQSVKYLTPDSVIEYIMLHKLFQS